MSFRGNFVLNLYKNGKSFLQAPSKINNILMSPTRRFSKEVTSSATPLVVKKSKAVSKAMKAYLERSRENDEFMKQQHLEYQIGKRHLANIMGENPETFTQEDVDRAIEYLFPSGLFDPRARPQMKQPEDVFPPRKAAEFDETGRPFHSMFYTGKPNFFKLLFDIIEETNKLYALEERMQRRGVKPDAKQKIEMAGYHWKPKDQLETLLVETVADIEYGNFTNAMDRLVSQAYSYTAKEFIEQYKTPLMDHSKQLAVPKTQIDENGRQFITTYECLRKSARADVTIRKPGTGQITINGQDVMYFDDVQCREQLLFPLVFTDMLSKVDVEANVRGGGTSGQAGAIRWGIAMSLRSFVEPEVIESMRLAGLLQRDYRRRERKKFGQEGARRKYTWKKR